MTEPSGAAPGGRLTTEQLADAGTDRERPEGRDLGADRPDAGPAGPGGVDDAGPAGPGGVDPGDRDQVGRDQVGRGRVGRAPEDRDLVGRAPEDRDVDDRDVDDRDVDDRDVDDRELEGRDRGAEEVPVIDLRDGAGDEDVAGVAAGPGRSGPDRPDPARLHGDPERGTPPDVTTPGGGTPGAGAPGASTPGGTTPGTGPLGGTGGELLAPTDRERMTARWRDIQVAFVDQPQQAVQEADSLVAELMQQLAQVFAAERRTLEGQWSRGDEVGTEELRVALQRYRSFFQRLLSV